MGIEPDLTIDTSGTFCPVPIIETAKAIKGMAAGKVLLVVATDPGAEPDMKAWCKATGNELVEHRRQGKSFVFVLRKT
jgi:tRNA 2-thiouridine synthesizing protein A